MRRRAVLKSAGPLFAGGCNGRSSEGPSGDDPDSPEATVDVDSIDGSRAYEEPATTADSDREHLVIGLWMNTIPVAADPYPTDEEPLASNEVLQEFFDATASQDKYPGSEDRENEGEGEVYSMEVTAEQTSRIVQDSRAVEYNEEGFRRGRFVDHDGTYIWYTVETRVTPQATVFPRHSGPATTSRSRPPTGERSDRPG